MRLVEYTSTSQVESAAIERLAQFQLHFGDAQLHLVARTPAFSVLYNLTQFLAAAPVESSGLTEATNASAPFGLNYRGPKIKK
jgi:hypothetical protein